jgi:hypothetical protein
MAHCIAPLRITSHRLQTILLPHRLTPRRDVWQHEATYGPATLRAATQRLNERNCNAQV